MVRYFRLTITAPDCIAHPADFAISIRLLRLLLVDRSCATAIRAIFVEGELIEEICIEFRDSR